MNALANVKSVAEDNFEVQFEVVSATNILEETRERRKCISEAIDDIDKELDDLERKLKELNTEIDKLTNQADGLDYIVAVGSGILSGAIDILFVNEFSLEESSEWGVDKINKFVEKIAQKQGYEGEGLHGAVKYLEDNYPIVADKVTNDFGGGLQHHLRDFSHHPTPVGLFFSLLSQFTHKVYGTDVAGIFKIVEIKETDLILVGKNFYEKITFGVINWFFHMVSDMAGSSTSISSGKIGTGLPGPIGSLLKEISVLPIFKKMDDRGYKEFSVWISKLFNGTLLGEHDENGKIVKPLKFDLRTEIGVFHQLEKQTIPVVINESIIRGFYFIRRFSEEIRIKEISSVKELSKINWKSTLPFNNRTIIRMLTISTGTMLAIDLADAAIESAIESGGVNNPIFIHKMIVKVNFVGVGRFAVAVGSDVVMEVKSKKVKRERSKVMNQVISLSKAKLYYKNAEVLCEYCELYEREVQMHETEADIWIAVEKTKQSIEELYRQAEKVAKFYIKAIKEMDDSFERIEYLLPGVEKMNPGLVNEMLRRIKR